MVAGKRPGAEWPVAQTLRFEAGDGRGCVEHLHAVMEWIGRLHPFAKGLGLAAPKIGIGRAAAVAQPPGRDEAAIVLLYPRITAVGEEMDEQCSGLRSVTRCRSPGCGALGWGEGSALAPDT